MKNIVTVEIIKGTKDIQGKKVKIIQQKDPGKIKAEFSLFQLPVQKTIESIDWEYQQGRSAGKAAAGAIVGGVLTGGIGLIAGAAIGGRKKDTSTAVITFTDQEQLFVKCTAKEYETLLKML